MVLKVVLFLLLVLNMLFYSDSYFREDKIFNLTKDSYRDRQSDLDLAIFGSSHAYSTYDPRIFETELNLHSFNFGGSAQRLLTGLPLMEEVVGKNELKIAVVDIFDMSVQHDSLGENSRMLQLQTFDNTEFSFTKVKSFSTIFSFKKLLDIFPTLRNHGSWFELVGKSPHIPKDDADFYKGYVSKFESFDSQTWERFLTKVAKRKKEIPKALAKSESKIIDKVISVFQSKGIPLIFVNAPSYNYQHDKRYQAYQHLIGDYVVSQGFDYIDYNLLTDKIGLKKADFKDPNHLNPKGALKVSAHLSDFIKRNYSIPNRENIEFDQNRYDLISENFKNSTLKFEDLGEQISSKANINAVYVFKTSSYGYELVFRQSDSDVNNVHVKLKFGIDDEDKKKHLEMFGEQSMDGNIVKHYPFLRRDQSILYKGSRYSIYQFRAPYDNIMDMELYVGPKRDLKIFDSINIKQKN